MLNPNSRSTAFLILAIGAVSLTFILLVTEGILDNSILHQKLLFSSVTAVAFLFPVLYIISGLKLSTVMSVLSMTIVASMCVLQYFTRVTYGVFFVDYKAIFNGDTESIKHLINQNPVTVLFYGKRSVYYDPSKIKNITEEELKEFKVNILFRVQKRRSVDNYNIVKIDFTSLRVRNRGDEIALANLLNSFYFTKLMRNTILIFKVDNYLNLINSGFNRPVIDDTEEGKRERKEEEDRINGIEKNENGTKSEGKKTASEDKSKKKEDIKTTETNEKTEKDLKNEDTKDLKNENRKEVKNEDTKNQSGLETANKKDVKPDNEENKKDLNTENKKDVKNENEANNDVKPDIEANNDVKPDIEANNDVNETNTKIETPPQAQSNETPPQSQSNETPPQAQSNEKPDTETSK